MSPSILRNPSQSRYVIGEIPTTHISTIVEESFDKKHTLFWYLFHAVLPDKRWWTSSSSLHFHSSSRLSREGLKTCSDLHPNQAGPELVEFLHIHNHYRDFLYFPREG